MKLLHLSAAITATAISLIPSLHVRALAIEPDYLCFFKTDSGRVVDLSDSVCHGKKSQLADAAKNNAFIEAYKNQAMKYADVRDNLIANIENSPEEKIQQAKAVCTDLKAGLSMDEIEEDRADDSIDRVGKINASIVNKLATQYFCNNASMSN